MGYEACILIICGAAVAGASLMLGLISGFRLAKGAEPGIRLAGFMAAKPEETEEESEEFAIARRRTEI